MTISQSAIASLLAQTAQLAPDYLDHENGARVEREQACYLPVGSGDPVLGKIEGQGDTGVWVASGHSCWGIVSSASSIFGISARLGFLAQGADSASCC